MKRLFAYLALLGISTSFIACSEAARNSPQKQDPVKLNKQLPSFKTTDAFSLEMFKTIHARAKDQNLIVSPTSVSLALGMLVNGAKGETKEELLKALRASGKSVQALNDENAALALALQKTDSDTTVSVANAIWLNEEQAEQINPNYTDTLKKDYLANAEKIPFDDTGKDKINNWVSDKTKGKIPTLISQLDKRRFAYLINAIYFHSKWQRAFEAKLTRPEPFHLLSGKTDQAPMMHQLGKYAYLKAAGYEAIELPYKGDEYALVIVLPNKEKNLDALIEQLSSDEIAQWDQHFSMKSCDLALPKFKFEKKFGLIEPLKQMGIRQVFDEHHSDLTKMVKNNNNAYVSEAFQKAMFELDEEGTTAAAATAIGITLTTSVQQPKLPIPFKADRPFMFVLRHKPSGTNLFMGTVYNPIEIAKP